MSLPQSHSPLAVRSELLRGMRDYFYGQGLVEVTTPTVRQWASSEIFLDSIKVPGHGYLQTSPEHAMKRLVAEHQVSMFQICPAYRGGEAGRRHRMEFQMLEWYRCDFSLEELIGDVEGLLNHVTGLLESAGVQPVGEIQRRSYRELFVQHVGLNPHVQDVISVRALLQGDDYGHLDDTATMADYLDAAFSSRVEPELQEPVIVYDFPACQAAMAKLRKNPEGEQVSARFELYLSGMEIANAYQELTDASELRTRINANNEHRVATGKPDMGADDELLAAVARLPRCAGIAVGVDRLLMALLGVNDISMT